jgi:hypothetical protein
MGLVTEVHASFQELTHIEDGKRHLIVFLFPVGPPRINEDKRLKAELDAPDGRTGLSIRQAQNDPRVG